MRKVKTHFFTGLLLVIVTIICFEHCKEKITLPESDPDNGGLLLPKKFEALVVVDSIGNARHLAVNDNGDIYVKLTFNQK